MGKFKFSPRNANGFNMLELIMMVSILASLVTAAAPTFAKVLNKTHIMIASTQLSHTLVFSRNYALQTGTTVIVCHAKDTSMSQCSEKRKRNTNWSNGIISYADINGNNNLDEHDQILTVERTHNSVTTVFNQNGRLRFFADGSARSAGFYLCSKASKEERHIRLLYTGRARTTNEMNKKQRNTCLSKALI